MKNQVPVVLVSVFYIRVVGVWSSSDHHAIPKALNNITPVIYHPVTQISLQHRARFVETALPIYQRELHKSGDKNLFSPCRLLKTYWNHNDII